MIRNRKELDAAIFLHDTVAVKYGKFSRSGQVRPRYGMKGSPGDQDRALQQGGGKEAQEGGGTLEEAVARNAEQVRGLLTPS